MLIYSFSTISGRFSTRVAMMSASRQISKLETSAKNNVLTSSAGYHPYD